MSPSQQPMSARREAMNFNVKLTLIQVAMVGVAGEEIPEVISCLFAHVAVQLFGLACVCIEKVAMLPVLQ
jgi:hypothetical protein